MEGESTLQDIQMTDSNVMESEVSDFMKVKEVAKRMSVTPDFIYKKLRTDEIRENNRVIKVRFEDFIYEYDKTISKIEKFLKLGEHVRKKDFFKPEHSANNTQLIKKHPNDYNDIKKIETELSEFLFPFENYPDVDTSGKSFYGAERKVTE